MNAAGAGIACWCCGTAFTEQRLVRLCEHPEVAVCADCTRYLRRESATGPVRRRLRGVRRRVIARRWHRRPVIGSLLRRIDDLLP